MFFSVYSVGNININIPEQDQEVRCDRVPVWFNIVILEMMWEGKSMIQFKQYDWAVRCSHTPPHSLVLTHHNATVTVTELLPVDRTGLWGVSVAASSLPPVSQSTFKLALHYNDRADKTGEIWGWMFKSSTRHNFLVKAYLIKSVSMTEDGGLNSCKSDPHNSHFYLNKRLGTNKHM